MVADWPAEEHGLHALAEHRDEGERGEAEHLSAVHEELDLPLELLPDVLCGQEHPEHHGGQDDDREERGEPLEQLFRRAGELEGRREEDAPNDEAGGDGDGRAEVHIPAQRRLTDLREVRDKDADDQRGLDALAQPDDQAGDDPDGYRVFTSPGF